MEKYNPLISIVVSTYNNSKYILEALESFKAQTYQNIELIITDDCSIDDSVELCKKWVEENKNRFVNTEIITSEKNTGTPANFNRGVKASKGEWVKIIAGDDALESYYCEELVKYINNNPDVLCIVTNVTVYNDTFINTNINYKTNSKKYKMYADNITAEEQFQCLLRNGLVHTTGQIINKKVYEDVCYYDERYHVYEDRPFWIDITKGGIKIYLYEIYGAKYRKHIDSVQIKGDKTFWSKVSIDYYYVITDRLEYYPFFERFLRRYVLNVEYCYFKLFKNKKYLLVSCFVFILTFIPNLYLRLINRKYRF